ncbi:CASC3/Barentsz eIF4AIII binding-domain-containing protein [Kalaharituber pfeilii]|nr:CASC3/Barentsz eIF4AIII binding-domain-containing protein [Kalaharituber pfeilii]
MATTNRRRNLIASRRPIVEEGEEGGEDLYNGNDLDSLSDDSGLSEEEEEEEEEEEDDDDEEDDEDEQDEDENRDLNDKEQDAKGTDAVAKGVAGMSLKESDTKAISGKMNGIPPKEPSTSQKPSGSGKLFLNGSGLGRADTEFFLNGFKGDQQITIEEEDYEEVGGDDKVAQGDYYEADGDVAEEDYDEAYGDDKVAEDEKVSAKPTALDTQLAAQPKQQEVRHETPYERRRREHEEYKRRRDTDPAFVPNRGAFFMHDHRHQGGGYKPFWRGHGGGRGGFKSGVGFGRDPNAPPEPLDGPWRHDAYEELLAAERPPFNPQLPAGLRAPRQEVPRKFGRMDTMGTTKIIVNLPGMKYPITFSEVPYKVYTRLPYHRPPLRRDKPIRISIPDQPIKYIYPHHTRSFVFIPRAMRPGGSGFAGGGPPAVKRGGLNRGSTRSIHGGSVVSQSATMSRGSSFQPENQPQTEPPAMQVSADATPANVEVVEASATETVREETVQQQEAKPAVPAEPDSKELMELNQTRVLPSPNKTAAPVVKPPPSYPTPVPPIHDARGTPVIPMHQPRPQKTVSVADIETPVSMHYSNQFVQHSYLDGTATPTNCPASNLPAYSHSRQPSYQSQPSGTPLSQIPERAVHAQPFQPSTYTQQPAPYYYSSQPQSHTHPIHHHAAHTIYSHQPPPYTASPQYVSSPLPNGTPTVYHTIPAAQQPPAVPTAAPPMPMPTTIAQESNGTVYYYDPSTYYAAYAATSTYPGMAPLTPAPDPGVGVPVGGTMYYYPTTGATYYNHAG